MKNKLNVWNFVAIAAALIYATLLPTAVHALGVRIPNQDAEAIARGNAFAATADNASAIYYNPAGITQLPGQNIQVGFLNYFGINTHYENAAGGGANSKFHNVPVPELYYTFTPEKCPVSFGLGIYAPFGLATEYYDNSGFHSIASSAKLQYITFNPVVAWKVCDTFSIAAGPDINYSKIDIKRGLVPGSMDVFQFTGTGVAVSMNAGLRWQPCDQWAFGLNYRSPSTMHYSGSSTYTPTGVLPFGPASSSTTADFQFPQIVSGGISYRPTPNWNIEADMDWADWHTLRTVTLNGTKNNANFPFLGLGDLPLALNWHSSYFYELGVTRYLDNGWFVSAGYFLSTETTSTQNFNPAVPDTLLHVGSLGFGRKGPRWKWAIAAQIITGPARSVSNTGTSPTGDGSYQLFVPTLSASAGYKF